MRPRSKRKETEAACGIHAAPVQNENKWRRRVGFTPPPLLTPANTLEMERGVGTTPLHCRRCWRRIPPLCWGGIIELEGGGVWFSHCLVGIWNVQMGSRGHEWPPPTPAVSPVPSFPIPPVSSLCFPSLLLLLTPTRRFLRLHPSKRGEVTVQLSSPVTWHLVIIQSSV